MKVKQHFLLVQTFKEMKEDFGVVKLNMSRAVARKNKDWGNIHGWIPRLAIQGLYDDYVETKHCQDQTLNDWGKCLGLPHTGYGPDV